MNCSSANEDRELLASVEGDPERLRDLTQEFLKLPSSHLSAVHEALQEGGWRNARNPRRYLKVVAIRIAEKTAPEGTWDKRLIPLSGRDTSQGKPVSEADFLDHLVPQGGIQRDHGVWKAKNDDYSEPYYEDELLDQVPNELKREELVVTPISDPDPSFSQPQYRGVITERLDWEKIATEAHLDQWMRRVLEYRLRGVSRDGALAEQESPANFKKLQAAWRRFHRRGLTQLKEVLNRKAA